MSASVPNIMGACADALTLHAENHYYSDRLREARATVERMAEALEAVMEMATSDEVYHAMTMNFAKRLVHERTTEARAALRAYHGDKP